MDYESHGPAFGRGELSNYLSLRLLPFTQFHTSLSLDSPVVTRFRAHIEPEATRLGSRYAGTGHNAYLKHSTPMVPVVPVGFHCCPRRGQWPWDPDRQLSWSLALRHMPDAQDYRPATGVPYVIVGCYQTT